jgi:hypothetical protein
MIRALTGALLLLAIGAAPAAACGAARLAAPAKTTARATPAPWVIGDSTGIFGTPMLGRMGVEADARGCRQFAQGVALIAQRRARRLPTAVVLALGANGPVTRSDIARARRILGPRRFLLLVTSRNHPAGRQAMLAAERAHPDRVLVLDWLIHSAGHGSWFGGDGLHVSPAGARAWARLIRHGLRPFFRPRRALGLPLRRSGADDCGFVRGHGRRTRVYLIRGELGCLGARRRLRAPRLHPAPGWRYYDWRTVGRGPWTDVMVRGRRTVIAGVAARPLAD